MLKSKKSVKAFKKQKKSLSARKPTANRMGSLEKVRRMATVIQDSNDAITFQDLEGNILAWNRGAEIIYGYSQAEALNMNIVDTVPPEYQEEARQFLASLKRGELVSTLETKRKTKDGRIVDVWLTNTKLTDDKGNLTGLATTERDISERKRTEASLREKFLELEYLREGQIALSESMRGEQIISKLGQSILSHLVPFTNSQLGAFYLVTDDKKLQMVSGYALPKNSLSDQIIEFGEGLVGQVALKKQSVLIENVPSDYFIKVKSALGEMVPKALLICPILYENKVIGVIELGSLGTFTEHQQVFLNHVSENIGIAINTSDVRKKIQRQNEALNKAQILLEEKATEVQRASQYKTEFLANMSHELRTPLNSSLILAKLLMDNAKQNLTPEQTQYATSIYSSSKDLLNLINDILDLSKVEAGKLDIRVEDVVLSQVVDGLKRTFQSIAEDKQLVFDVKQDHNMPIFFKTDRQRLDQILKNLISNALKFTQHGSVTVRLYSRPDGNIAFEVSDTGIGIPKLQHTNIFEAFRQADGTTNRKYGGTGLGLSISKDLAKLLNGSIEVESTVDQGSCFTLVLPATLSEEVIIPETTSEIMLGADQLRPIEKQKFLPFEDDRGKLGLNDQTILVIEDDLIFAKILLDLVHEFNYKCIVGQGAEEGLSMALEYSPSAVFLDVRLPDHLGLTVLDRLKANSKTRHIPIILMSAEDYRKAGLEMGAIDFMSKPVERDEIKAYFKQLESRFLKKLNRALIIQGSEACGKEISDLIADSDVEVKLVDVAQALLVQDILKYDCLIVDISSNDFKEIEFLEQMALKFQKTTIPIIVNVQSSLSVDQQNRLKNVSRLLNIKVSKTTEGLFDQVTLVLHRRELKMSFSQKSMIAKSRTKNSAFDGRKILLVDDDIRNIFAMTSALEERGATIFVGRNGHEALDRLNQNPEMDLVLMDIMMPEMDGYEATRRIRKQKRFEKLPIIAVTAKAMIEDQAKCLQAGTNDYVSKPVDLDKLQSLIKVWMNQ